jgi:N-acetylmuramoyl-L-alanine amidase
MIRQFFLLGAVTFAVAAHASAPIELRDIALVNAGNTASVSLALSDVLPQKVFTLSSPARVVIDLRRTRLRRGVRAPHAAGIVTAIRTGARADGTLRIVIELNSAVAAHSHWVARAHGPGQLVIDLGSASRSVTAPAVQPQVAPPQSTPAPQAVAMPAVPPQPIRALHAPQDTDQPIVVAVDAGHGGNDPGAIGHGGTREKDITLAIARALAQRIDSEPGMRAVLTRNRDEFVELGDRIERAKSAKADLFVSVHADSIRDASITGASVYVLSERGATNQAAAWLADRENSADLKGGVPLQGKNVQLDSVLIDLSQTASISASMIAAERVLIALDSVGEVRKPRVQQAGFVVLKSRAMASMLVETAYISNPQEERRLRTSAEQDKLANAIFSGIRTFFEANPPPGTRFAQLRRGLARATPANPSMP